MFINLTRWMFILTLIFINSYTVSAVDLNQSEINNALIDKAFTKALSAKLDGPRSITLGNQAVLQIPDGFAFIPKKEATAFLQATGNQASENFYGLVIGDSINGFVDVSFDGAGFIMDEDAKNWNADELLQNLKDGTEANNVERRKRGLPEFIVKSWIEKPAYDSTNNRLIWSAETQNKIPVNLKANSSGANYNTYQLGREGYISMNLVTDMEAVEAQKPITQRLLAGLQFNPGKRYKDFNASTDQVAAYGLAALVGGVAAKKLGLLALTGVFLAKFAKIAVLAAFGLIAGLGKFFSKNKAS